MVTQGGTGEPQVDRNQQFDVLYSDEHVIVVNKNAGLLSTPAHGENSLIDDLNRKFFGRHEVFAVHRLDRETSGLLVFARTPSTARELASQFARHSVERQYIAIVAGALDQAKGSFDGAINGKRALTHFQTISTYTDSTFVSLRLETGRRNQIRIHLANDGHPIIGDSRLGKHRSEHPAWNHKRIALHAKTLGFWHPERRESLAFESIMPIEFTRFLDPHL